MPTTPREPKEVLSLRLHPGSIERIDAVAEKERRTRSDMIRVLLLERLEEYEAKHGLGEAKRGRR